MYDSEDGEQRIQYHMKKSLAGARLHWYWENIRAERRTSTSMSKPRMMYFVCFNEERKRVIRVAMFITFVTPCMLHSTCSVHDDLQNWKLKNQITLLQHNFGVRQVVRWKSAKNKIMKPNYFNLPSAWRSKTYDCSLHLSDGAKNEVIFHSI